MGGHTLGGTPRTVSEDGQAALLRLVEQFEQPLGEGVGGRGVLRRGIPPTEPPCPQTAGPLQNPRLPDHLHDSFVAFLAIGQHLALRRVQAQVGNRLEAKLLYHR